MLAPVVSPTLATRSEREAINPVCASFKVISFFLVFSNNPKGKVPRALPVSIYVLDL